MSSEVIPRRTQATDPTLGSTGPGTTSADELGVSLNQVNPDPYLDAFAESSQPSPSPMAPPSDAVHELVRKVTDALDGLDLDVPPSAELPVVSNVPSSASAIVGVLNLDSPKGTTPPGGVDLYAPPLSQDHVGAGRVNRAETPHDTSGDGDDDLPARGTHWAMVLLASYASAVTLGLIWVLWGQRLPRERAAGESDLFPPARTAADPGHRAGLSRKQVPPPPLPEDRIMALGQSLRVGSLEVAPLEVSAGSVLLKRAINEFQKRFGGDDALKLKLRLKNLSADSILVPLDEAFIRERGRGIHDSFIELGPNQKLDLFPLAVESEWSILGQEFRELEPGESFETLVVSAPGAVGRLGPEMLWRIRLRTDINQTETIGVRFRAADVHAPPPGRDHRLEREEEMPEGDIQHAFRR
jgi:hypothetical protein